MLASSMNNEAEVGRDRRRELERLADAQVVSHPLQALAGSPSATIE